MLSYRKGDLLKAFQSGEVDVIGHQCNCFCTMGSGIAPQIAKLWPSVREADNKTIFGDRGKLGTLNFVRVEEGHIFNLYGQYRYGSREPDTDYEALDSALKQMSEMIDHTSKVGFPKIGCGKGGGNWDIVKAMIMMNFIGVDVTVYDL